ncbi:MAG TPA: bifunctional diaminohydroxyphosphoribosylaminopyrimidine deaminase/5-amino-6-(5-phosphoribosylamino)uracil reductase RibD [bacterium]|nr:bifunctional diaminohydroxyphosphoribosylaminopyrimidine deaminase/5-amino-6-(5-phosphoribosylamino)uracil reductase RibD [bacterium]
MTDIDIKNKMMAKAVEISEKCTISTYPNPKVGAVIFNDEGTIITEGFTSCYGGDHAEINALKKIEFRGEGLNMAVTLEPCNHFGKTPPCSKAILKAGIKKVFIAKHEENGKACNGACFLQENGVEIEFMDEFSADVEEINRFFFKNIRTGLPWVTVKVAVSSDGFITEKEGTPSKISGEVSKVYVHQLRTQHMAIAVGAKTVNSDNPLLTVRHAEGLSPRPVLFSRNLSLNLNAKVIKNSPVIITSSSDTEIKDQLERSGAVVETLKNGFSVSDALSSLFKKYCLNSILLEGGASLIKSFIMEKMIDEFQINTSPKTFGHGVKLFDSETFEIFSNDLALQNDILLGEDFLRIYRRK